MDDLFIIIGFGAIFVLCGFILWAVLFVPVRNLTFRFSKAYKEYQYILRNIDIDERESIHQPIRWRYIKTGTFSSKIYIRDIERGEIEAAFDCWEWGYWPILRGEWQNMKPWQVELVGKRLCKMFRYTHGL